MGFSYVKLFVFLDYYFGILQNSIFYILINIWLAKKLITQVIYIFDK